MAEGESAEMSSSSLSGVRERMQEKKKGALRTARLNTSLASKIKTKIVSKYNSSIMKVSLKQNNKALALALNAEKANVQRLTREKTILQKEVKQCHFQNAVLRHRLSFLNNTLKKMDNLMAAVRMAELSEFHTNSASLSSGQKSSMTEDSWADDVADGQLLRIGMRVPISKLHDAEQQAGSSTAVQTSSGELQTPASDAGELQRLASNEPLKIVPIASKDTLLPQHDGKLQFHQEENSNKVTDTLATEEAFHDSHIFGDIRPLQDLKNARALSRSGLEESSGRPSGQKWKPTCYKGPLINRKLRQGDPFTDRSSSTLLSTKENKKPVKAKAMTKKMKENQEGTPEECLGAKAMNA
ncbi:shugoshin 2-like isoform X2 [Poecile atricapillus]|uniref:shugoshin 2-like isoform X2 n=1 Tax=Poecile atricapillus TaxID=48891 RepID=UPI002739A2B2|nr:shugoshin 2-like isoform X2 [Poecile atricapillus]